MKMNTTHTRLLAATLACSLSILLHACSSDDKPTPTGGGMTTAGDPFADGQTTTNGGTTVGDVTVGGTTVGDTTIGDTTIGNTTIGNTTIGNTTIGDTTVGDPTVGDTTVGGTTVGGTTVGDVTGGYTTAGGLTDGDTTAGGTTDGGANPDDAIVIGAVTMADVDNGDRDTSEIAGYWDDTFLLGAEGIVVTWYSLITADGSLNQYRYQDNPFGSGANCFSQEPLQRLIRIRPGLYYNELVNDVFTARVEAGNLVGTDANGPYSKPPIVGQSPTDLMICR